ncbi:MAG TPA: sigma-70 family RNA polymerase sigma factor [Acidimicrobiia bacterium]|nr:sigma-70 family RNA polymerase sigma factor [Acidimicrobiia bacterium]
MTEAASLDRVLEECFRREWPVLVGAVARITGDLDRAEELVQDVLVTALDRWPFTGVPDRPGAWLLTAARNRARNALRDAARERVRVQAAAERAAVARLDPRDVPPIADDRLRLVFACCHPLLSPEAQVALTLRLVGGLSTRAIARAFLVPEPTVAQRLVRAKRTLAERGVRLDLPPEWRERLSSVLGVVYLIFNEGYAAAHGPDLTRPDLCAEALALGDLLAELFPGEGEVHGLVALMELQASRLAARVDDAGRLVVLADQDRAVWDLERVNAGLAALRHAEQLGPRGPLVLQAAIAAEHARAAAFEATDWAAIVALYDELHDLTPSPVVALNRSVAVAMADGPAAGLAALDEVVAGGELDEYHLLWATRADLVRRGGRPDEAAGDYRRALACCANPAELDHLRRRLAECEALYENAG